MQVLRAFIFLSVVLLFSNQSYSQTSQKYLLVLNKNEASLTILDPNDLKVLGKVTVGDSPHEVVASSDGKLAFVANYGAQTPGNSLSVIDLQTRKELRRVELSPLFRPHGIQEIGGKIYFTAETNRAIARFDPATNKVDWLMGTGQNVSHMIVGTSDQKRFFTANIGLDSVTMFEFANVPPAQSQITNIAVGKQPEAIDLSPDGKTVYATMPNINEIIVIDSATRKETKRMKLESTPLGIVFSKDGKFAFVSAVEKDFVLKIDLQKLETVAKAETGKAPDGIALTGM